jgi:hypothetical protein
MLTESRARIDLRTRRLENGRGHVGCHLVRLGRTLPLRTPSWLLKGQPKRESPKEKM